MVLRAHFLIIVTDITWISGNDGAICHVVVQQQKASIR